MKRLMLLLGIVAIVGASPAIGEVLEDTLTLPLNASAVTNTPKFAHLGAQVDHISLVNTSASVSGLVTVASYDFGAPVTLFSGWLTAGAATNVYPRRSYTVANGAYVVTGDVAIAVSPTYVEPYTAHDIRFILSTVATNTTPVILNYHVVGPGQRVYDQ